MTPEQLAQHFHTTYEALAPRFGYETRKASAVPWEAVPENNKNLMIATCGEMLKLLESEKETKSWEQDMADMAQIAREWHQYRLTGDESPLASPSKLEALAASGEQEEEDDKRKFCEECGFVLDYSETNTCRSCLQDDPYL